jgi:hypothetical protein
MPLGPTTGRTDVLLLALVLAVLGVGSGVMGVGCSQSFTPLEPEPEPIPVFASSPRDLISKVIVDILPDSVWALEDVRKGARFRIPEEYVPINWSTRTLDLVGFYEPLGQTELHILDGPGGNVIQSWDFYFFNGIPEGRFAYYPLPTSMLPESFIIGNTMWVEMRLVRTQSLHLRIVEKAVPYDVIQLPGNTLKASLITSASEIGILALLRDLQVVELDLNGTLVRSWSADPGHTNWSSSTFVEGQFLFLFQDNLCRLGPEDSAPDTLAHIPGKAGIASSGGRLYMTQRGGQDQNGALLIYDLEAVLTGSDIRAALQDSIPLSFNPYYDLFETSDGALLAFDYRSPASLVYLLPSGLVVGEWETPFFLGDVQSAYYDRTGLYVVPCALDYQAVLADPTAYYLPPVLFRFPVTIDP